MVVAQKQKNSPVLKATIHGKLYVLDLEDITGTEARAFRRAVGVPIVTAAALIGTGEWDALEVMAGMKWLIDRREDPDLEYEKVLDKIAYKDIAQPEEGDEPDPPG